MLPESGNNRVNLELIVGEYNYLFDFESHTLN